MVLQCVIWTNPGLPWLFCACTLSKHYCGYIASSTDSAHIAKLTEKLSKYPAELHFYWETTMEYAFVGNTFEIAVVAAPSSAEFVSLPEGL